MNSPLLQLLVLAGIAVFLILRLKSVLGTRDGYEKPPVPRGGASQDAKRDFEVIEGGPDHDITDHVPEGSSAARALTEMKRVEPSFNVSEFMGGARGAYEMILMGFERGDLAEIKPFLAEDVYETFAEVVEAREEQGLTIEAEFVGKAPVGDHQLRVAHRHRCELDAERWESVGVPVFQVDRRNGFHESTIGRTTAVTTENY